MFKPVRRIVKFLATIPLPIIILITTSCSGAQPTIMPESIRVQYSIFTQPWLQELNDCAGNNIVTTELRAADLQNPSSADMVMRIGLPDNLSTLIYQIGTEDIIVIVNPQNPVTSLSASQVRGLFTGQIQTWANINGSQAPVQVWVFPTGEDVERIFEHGILEDSPVTSQARLANNPDEMIHAISKDANAIGLLTSRANSENIPNVITVAKSLPVIAIIQSEPKGSIAYILTCLQKGGK